MDFLKSTIASAIAKGSSLPFTFGDKVDIDQSLFALYNGTRKEDGLACSIFSFDIASNRSRLPLAKNALRKFRTLRHPGVVKVLDTLETETHIYIFTERITPLNWYLRRKSLGTEVLKWGLFCVAKTVKFINEEASSMHGSVRTASVFTSESGEWKLGGFEILSSMKEDDAVVYNYGSLTPNSARYSSPEVASSGWDAIRKNPIYATDSYGYGILVYEAFNGPFVSGAGLAQQKMIPPSMQQYYRRLINSNPKSRLSVGHFLEQGRRSGGFFETHLIHVSEGIDNLGMKSETDRDQFLEELDEVAEDDFPEQLFKMKVLPELLKSVEFGGGGPKVFGLVMKISGKLSDEEYETNVTPVIVRLFMNPDRAIRVCLLDNLSLMIDRLTQKTVNDKIFPQMTTGFSDVAPILREQSVKAVLIIINKLSDRTINGELLKQLAKTANDPEPGIRANTTICLGKIARNLGSSSRSKVLLAAFTRSLRDPFLHARNSSLLALAATVDIFSESDCASRILPALGPTLLDPEKVVRDSAFKTLDIILARIRKHASTLPESCQSAPSSSGPRPAVEQGASWTGWAISSFTNKLNSATGEIQQSPPKQRPASADPASVNLVSKSGYLSDPKRTESAPRVSLKQNEEEADAWTAMSDDAFFDASDDVLKDPPPEAIAAPYDDGGEPDFAGWLAAQQNAKRGINPAGAKKVGLQKALPNHNVTKRPATVDRKPPAVVKPKATDEEEDWSAWD